MGRLSFPLDAEATDAADDRFYAAHPEMVGANGKRIPLSATDPAQAAMRREWIRLYEEELAKKSQPAKPDPDDDEDPVNPVAPCPGDKPCADCTPIRAVTLESLTFTSDHALLKDEVDAWTNTGVKMAPPDWTPAMTPHPVSMTMEKPVELEIEWSVEDDDACPEDGEIIGPYGALGSFGPDAASFAPSATPTKSTPASHFVNPRKIFRFKFTPRWRALADSMHEMGRSRNDMFVTWGPSKEGEHDEDGATLKRMREAVDRAAKAGSAREIEVIDHLFDEFDRYVLGIRFLSESEQRELRARPDLLAKMSGHDWPTYFNDPTGAWPIADFAKWGAECQAICRFIRGVMRQLGAKSKLDFRTYTADFSDPEIVLDRGRPSGPRPDRTYLLADRPIRRWKTYWRPVNEGEVAPVGWNNFEAYLKVEPDDGGATRLFGGGVGLLEKDRNPLHVFYALAELKGRWRRVKNAAGVTVDQFGWRVTRMHRYRDRGPWSGNLP